MKLDDELAKSLWDVVVSRLPEKAMFALAICDGSIAVVVSNIPQDEDVEGFLRFMAEQHARSKEKPNSPT